MLLGTLKLYLDVRRLFGRRCAFYTYGRKSYVWVLCYFVDHDVSRVIITVFIYYLVYLRRASKCLWVASVKNIERSYYSVDQKISKLNASYTRKIRYIQQDKESSDDDE